MIWWDRVERLLIGVFGACALAVGVFQVAGRYIDPRLAFPWGDEVVIYFTVWAMFIATSQLVRRDGHVRPDLVLRALPPQGQRWVECFNCCVAIAFCAGLVWCGYQIVSDSYALGERSITGLGFPMYLYYAALLVGGALMLARYVIRLHRYLFRFDATTMVIGPNLDH